MAVADNLSQLLFVFRFDDCIEGGESTFLDAYPVVEELRRKHPKHFEVLTRVPYINHRIHDSLDGLYVIRKSFYTLKSRLCDNPSVI